MERCAVGCRPLEPDTGRMPGRMGGWWSIGVWRMGGWRMTPLSSKEVSILSNTIISSSFDGASDPCISTPVASTRLPSERRGSRIRRACSRACPCPCPWPASLAWRNLLFQRKMDLQAVASVAPSVGSVESDRLVHFSTKSLADCEVIISIRHTFQSRFVFLTHHKAMPAMPMPQADGVKTGFLSEVFQ